MKYIYLDVLDLLDEMVKKIECKSKKRVHFNTKVKFKTIPNRDTLIPDKSDLWWCSQEYFYNRCVFNNEIRFFMFKYGFTNFNQCKTLFWEDYTGSALIL